MIGLLVYDVKQCDILRTVLSACSTKTIACECSQFLVVTFRSNNFKNKTGPNVTQEMAYSSGVHNVFEVWNQNYHLLAIRLPRIKKYLHWDRKIGC